MCFLDSTEAPEGNARLFSCQMLHYAHQLASSRVCLPFVPEQVAFRALSLKTAAMRAARVRQELISQTNFL